MTYRITPEEEDEIDRAYDDRDAARARARRLQAKIEALWTALKQAADDLDENGLPVEARRARHALGPKP